MFFFDDEDDAFGGDMDMSDGEDDMDMDGDEAGDMVDDDDM